MKRSDFLKSLAVILSAPSVLVSSFQEKPDLAGPAIADAGLYESGTVTAAANAVAPRFNAFWWKVTDAQVEDAEFMKYLLTDPRSDFWKRAHQAGVDLTKPHEMMVGFTRDDFCMGEQTIVVRQPDEPREAGHQTTTT